MKDFLNKLEFVTFILILMALGLGQLLRLEFGTLVFYPHDVLVGLFLLLVAFEAMRHRQLSPKQIKYSFKKLSIFKLEIGFLVFSLIWLGLKALNQQVLPLLYVLRLTYYAFFTYLTYKKLKIWQKKPGFRNWLWYFSVLLFIVWFGFLQYVFFYDLTTFGYLDWDNHLGRLVSSLIDPNFTGFLISTALVYTLSLKSKLNQKIWWLLAFLLNLGLVLTFSRASYLTLIIGLILSFITTQTQKLKSVILVLGLVFLASVMLVPKPPGEGGKLFRTASIKARLVHDLNINCDEINPSRLSQIVCGLTKDDVANYKILIPIKSGQNDNDTLPTPNLKLLTNHARWPNNLFVFIYTQLGLIGLVWFLALTIKWLWTLNKTHHLVSILIVMLLVHAQFNNTAFEPFVFLIFWGNVAEILRLKLDI